MICVSNPYSSLEIPNNNKEGIKNQTKPLAPEDALETEPNTFIRLFHTPLFMLLNAIALYSMHMLQLLANRTFE
jgi:hypothetical protein